MSYGNYWHHHMYLVKSHILSAPKTDESFLREPKKCRVGFFLLDDPYGGRFFYWP